MSERCLVSWNQLGLNDTKYFKFISESVEQILKAFLSYWKVLSWFLFHIHLFFSTFALLSFIYIIFLLRMLLFAVLRTEKIYNIFKLILSKVQMTVLGWLLAWLRIIMEWVILSGTHECHNMCLYKCHSLEAVAVVNAL